MKKRILAVLTCIAAALSLTACAGNRETPLNGSAPSVSSGTSTVSSAKTTSSAGAESSSGATVSSVAASSVGGSSSAAEQSKPTETSAPAESLIDWDTVPYADEMDFLYNDYNDEKRNISGVQITKYTGSEKLIKIPETIEGKPVVGMKGDNLGVFNYLDDISVKTPKSLVYIRAYCFVGCNNLTLYVEPEAEAGTVSLLGISGLSAFGGVPVFNNCNSLKLNLPPKSIRSIGEHAFFMCTFSDGTITMPDSLYTINEVWFYECDYKEIIYKGKTYDFSHRGAFVDAVNLGESGMKIEDGVLTKVSRGTVGTFTVPDNVTAIGASAFDGCLDITEVIIPDSVTSIDNEAFGIICAPENKPSNFNANVTYKGKTYKNNQLTHFFKAVNGN